MANLKTANVKFKDPKYNYSTSVNGDLSDDQIKAYFVGVSLNMGGIRWDHVNERETEVDDLQECIACEVSCN